MSNIVRIQQNLMIAMLVWAVATPTGFAFQADGGGAKPIDNSVARLIPVEFPLTAVDETRLIETLDLLVLNESSRVPKSRLDSEAWCFRNA